MKRLISYRAAGNIAIIAYLLQVIFHILVLLRIVPHEIVWGGRAQSYQELLPLEIFSLVINLVAAWLTAALMGYTGSYSLRKMARIFAGIMFLLFLLNTLGNLMAVTTTEKLFAIITLVLALLNLRLVIEPVHENRMPEP